jgi:alkylated DNA repair dioxygenase AlkB
MGDLFEPAAIDLPFTLPPGESCRVEWNDTWKGYDIHVPHGQLFYAEHFFNKRISDRTVEYFLENSSVDWRSANWREVGADEIEKIGFTNVAWKQDWIKLYGKRIPLPRLTSWYGDSGRAYTYSGIRSEPNQWNKGLLFLKGAVEQCAGVEFNSVLLNWYRDGEDGLSWHADDEKELGNNPTIASANFGATRDFLVRCKDDPSQKLTLPLKHGTLLLMKGELQHFWEHSVPKRKGVRGSRFNLTFRQIGVANQASNI